MGDYASKGVAGTGLGFGIAGTALAVLPRLLGEYCGGEHFFLRAGEPGICSVGESPGIHRPCHPTD